MNISFKTSLFAAALSCLVLLPGAVAGQESDQAGNLRAEQPTVIARVGDVEITGVDIAVIAEKSLDRLAQMSAEERADYLMQTAIDLNLMALAAQDLGLDDNEVFQRRLAFEQTRLLQELFIQHVVSGATDETALQGAYETYVAGYRPVAERSFGHILAETQEAADQILARLEAGEDFETVAREMSADPSAQVSADLGFMAEGEMIAPLSDAGFALGSVGDITSPIATQFGWHILKFEDERTSAPDSFEDKRSELGSTLVEAALASELAALGEKYGTVILESDTGADPAD
ncbi:peptidyl-prolyl cis-trans isomerase C [Devosia lucknowensis]|uniref:Parvulin-like PPIase n=1 Tax=Devosia lucknowensis TaxID=1096929 RepID=A0A1Y6F7F2_9HYPH|nr:peptidylprolyl isomerase [Devosia lucknowensis]SMQ68662.1 peptidyl-prolyl cis-trans isomerase C [Devosia lucknowensis]